MAATARALLCGLGAAALAAQAVPVAWAQTLPPQAVQQAERLDSLPPKPVPHTEHPPLDHSGRAESGKASYYALDGRRMADGHAFNPGSDAAASKTLPLGTTAKVTNLNTGKSATVVVQDRGPHVDGRVLDVTPKVANELDLKKHGVAPVVVKPIAVPQPDGGVKLGAGAAEAPPQQVEEAVKVTKEVAAAAK